MKDFIIMTDSCCDLSREIIKEKQIPFVSLTCSLDGVEYYDDFGLNLDPKVLFDKMKNGSAPTTSQPSVQAFYEAFSSEVDRGKDILYICVSSGLSGTFNSANIAKNMICDEQDKVRIEIVDVLTASLGEGLMVLKAIEMKEKGNTLAEIVSYLELNKLKLNTYITVDDLNHLKRGGRISSTAALLGTVLHIKPILSINHEGRVMPVIKVKGKKNVLIKLAEFVIERIENSEEETIAICHGNAIEEAEKLRDLILEKIKVKKFIINYIGPVVGCHGGPKALAIFFMGKHRQHHIIEI
jgi:DegV family protein with EDD domain